MKKFTPQEAANLFGCSLETIKEQYLGNAQVLEVMYKKAVKTGKKVNGYTASQLKEMTDDYYQRAR